MVSYINKKSKEEELTLPVILSLHGMLISNIRDDIAKFPVAIAELPEISAKTLRACADWARDRVGKGGVLLISRGDGKSALLLAFTKGIASGSTHAGNVLKKMLQSHGGQGGGREDLAQGGLDKALPLRTLIEELKKALS